MDYKKGDYLGLLERISTAVDKVFTDRQALTLTGLFKQIGWEASYRVSSKIERAPNVPKNVYGMILGMVDEERESIYKSTMTKSDWKNDPECASPEEFKMTMKCISVSFLFNGSVELCTKLSEGMTAAIKKDSLIDFLNRWFSFYSDLRKTRPDLLRHNKPFSV